MNISRGSSTPNQNSNIINSGIPERESDRASGISSSGAITPHSNSLSTPI